MALQKLDRYPEQGVCPICGATKGINIESSDVDDTGFSYQCECSSCKGTWHECYDLVFAGHWTIVGSNGEEYEDLPT